MSKNHSFFPERLPRPVQNTDDEIDLGQLLQVVWRGKWIIAICGLVGLLLAADKAFRNVIPMYSATSAVILDDGDANQMNFNSYDPGFSVDSLSFETQIRIFKSRHLAEKVILENGLLDDPFFNPYALRPVRIDDPTEVGLLKGVTQFLTSAKSLTSDAKTLVRGWIIPSDESSTVSDWEPSDREILDATIENTLGTVTVTNSSETYVYDLTVKTPSPDLSAKLSTSWAEAYVQDQRDVKFDEIQKATKWLSEKVAELKLGLEATEAEFSKFKVGTELLSSEVLESQNLLLKVNRDRLKDEQDLDRQIELKLAALELGRRQEDLAVFADLVQDARLSRLLENKVLSEAEKLAAIVARASILERQLESKKVRSEQKQSALVGGISELEKRVAFQSEDLITLQQLARDVEASRVVYEFFLSQLKEVSVQAGMLRSDSRVLAFAVEPNSPTPTNAQRTLLLGLLLGVFTGAGFVFLAEFFNKKFRTVEELEAGTGYLVLGEIPKIVARKRSAWLNYVITKPQSRVAESIRNLRTSLLSSNVGRAPKVVMVTSATAGEGKTSVSLALAASVSALQKKVLLVECDIRRRTFGEYFRSQNEPELISALSSNSALEECTFHRDKALGCDVLSVYAPTLNSIDLFSSNKFKEFLLDMRTKYDVVILDTPPVLIVSDARMIAPLVDATLFVARWNKTPLTNVQDGLRSLENIGAKVTGLVMTQISMKGLRAYSNRSAPSFSKSANKYYIES
ncbi:Wzz/FepE/Etk N-terminal domain-containing protein [Falsihalocynthiibacter sp. BN13B15]|uniref:Wzz/FepE/Etk N-terminal domain-containing protein n=1 Tax=Falsihalocynthiibacter sp. BN13B15 TaxID=3240871 RepID=UPI00350F3C17